MKILKNKKGFTLIELLVVITIIWILWFYWWSSFIEFYKNQEFNFKIQNIENSIKKEYLKINSKEIFDYEINMEKWKDFFIIYENIYDQEKIIKLNNNYQLEADDKIEIFASKNEKIIKDFDYKNFKIDWNYKFKFLENKKPLNNLFINKYDLENKLDLKEISDSENKNNSFNNLKIENIAWRKKIFIDWKKTKEVFLFFENNEWKEFYLLLKE